MEEDDLNFNIDDLVTVVCPCLHYGKLGIIKKIDASYGSFFDVEFMDGTKAYFMMASSLKKRKLKSFL